jgi:16S rRNA (cytosine967-C5)-methyltransferase
VSRYYSYLNSAEVIINTYKGEEPFTSFLKKYFAANKKFGSKDRKHVSHLCYCYFRLGKALLSLSVQDRVLVGLFLCSYQPNEMLEALKPEWNNKVTLSFEEKYSIINHPFSITDVFPWHSELSGGIDIVAFNKFHFTQPLLFLRIRPGYEQVVKRKLTHNAINFQLLSDSCMAMPNSTKLDDIIELDKEAVIQDYSSQRVGELLQLVKCSTNKQFTAWDCCAASGGKSILAKDMLGNIDLTVSDIRQSILINLSKRFAKAGIQNYQALVADLVNYEGNHSINNQYYSIVICDAPCTGSGTWARTPEQLFYFDEDKIAEYASLQKKIATNALQQLQAGGYFLYITCSVFKKENEEVVETVLQNSNLSLVKQQLIVGYGYKADTMFAALLKKSN